MPSVPAGQSSRAEVLRGVWYSPEEPRNDGPASAVVCGSATLPGRSAGTAGGDERGAQSHRRSTFDLRAVLDTLVELAARLCGAGTGLLRRFDGEVFRLTADYGLSTEARDFWTRHPHRPGRGSVTGRAAVERRTIHIPDVLMDPEYRSIEGQRVGGYRTLLGVPMLRQGVVIGCFSLERTQPQPFTDNQIELVTTFADQAVIAIETVRLFTELQEKNRALTQAHAQVTETLEQQMATAEILRVISRSQTDVQPVFDTIVRSAPRLCGAKFVHPVSVRRGAPAPGCPLQRAWRAPRAAAAALSDAAGAPARIGPGNHQRLRG